MNQSANPAITAPRHWSIGIGGMTCASCVAHIEKALQKVPGVASASVSLATESAAVDALPEVSPQALRKAIETAGYEVLETEYLLLIEGMTCASCVARIEKALAKVPGVVSASVNLATEQASVHVVQGMADVGQLIAAVERTGYQAHVPAAGTGAQEALKAATRAWTEAWLVALAALLSAPLVLPTVVRCWRQRNLYPPARISLNQTHASQTVAAGGIAEICNGSAQRRHLGQFRVGTNTLMRCLNVSIAFVATEILTVSPDHLRRL